MNTQDKKDRILERYYLAHREWREVALALVAAVKPTILRETSESTEPHLKVMQTTREL